MSHRSGFHHFRREWRPTPAQRRVLDALLYGGTNEEIANQLGLSLETVKWHISELLAETARTDRYDLGAWWAAERNKVEGPKALLWLLLAPGKRWRIVLPVGMVSVVALGIALLTLSNRDSRSVSPPAPFATGDDSAPIGLDVPKFETPAQSNGLTPIPTACPNAGPAVAKVEAADLASQGLVPLGWSISAPDCPIFVANRDDRAYVRFGGAGAALKVSKQQGSVSIPDLDFTGTAEVNGQDFSVVLIRDDAHTYQGPGIELAISATDGSGYPRRVAADSSGSIWISIDPLLQDAVVDERTGNLLDITQAQRLVRLLPDGRPANWAHPIFYDTWCAEAEPCEVSFRPWSTPLRAPVAGTLSCRPVEDERRPGGNGQARVLELDAGDFTLVFREEYTSAYAPLQVDCPPPRQVQAGEVSARITTIR